MCFTSILAIMATKAHSHRLSVSLVPPLGQAAAPVPANPRITTPYVHRRNRQRRRHRQNRRILVTTMVNQALYAMENLVGDCIKRVSVSAHPHLHPSRAIQRRANVFIGTKPTQWTSPKSITIIPMRRAGMTVKAESWHCKSAFHKRHPFNEG
jgi:hypothetical protein